MVLLKRSRTVTGSHWMRWSSRPLLEGWSYAQQLHRVGTPLHSPALIIMSVYSPKLSALAFAITGLFASSMAHASVVFTRANIDFTRTSTSFGYLGQQFTFTDLSTGSFDSNPVGVTTASGAAVTSLGAPFYNPPQPTSFFDPIRGSGTLVFDGSYQYSSFASTAIPYSASPGIIGLRLGLADGLHYGFAEFAGTDLVSYGFQSTAGVGIDVGAALAVTPVPEPETYALMLAGLGLVGMISRRRKVKSAGTPAWAAAA